jgi:hypothetical protein
LLIICSDQSVGSRQSDILIILSEQQNWSMYSFTTQRYYDGRRNRHAQVSSIVIDQLAVVNQISLLFFQSNQTGQYILSQLKDIMIDENIYMHK